MGQTSNTYGGELEVRPLAGWSETFWQHLEPYKQAIVEHPLFCGMSDGSLPAGTYRQALRAFYPLVENFPKYMALNLAKVRLHLPGHEPAKVWLIDNIKIEQRHAYWYEDWAAGFGIDAQTLRTLVPRPAADAVNHFLWETGRQASLEEGIAATNIAIEWATGEWSRSVYEGMKLYQKRGDAQPSRRTLAWLRAHAAYDDMHPYEAMELVRRICETPAQQDRALQAAKRGMAYYRLALDDCLAEGMASTEDEQERARTA
ncbi:MAG: iron-containing redox enzyme family protein [Alcanivoracaceae bacterium]|nr:iron-containing redox enzyme family protein [Alcanivoracaceae bacterium]